MMISTRGRYALRVLVDLAEHGGGLVPMKDVAARQGISKIYGADNGAARQGRLR